MGQVANVANLQADCQSAFLSHRVVGEFAIGGLAILPAAGFQPALAA